MPEARWKKGIRAAQSIRTARLAVSSSARPVSMADLKDKHAINRKQHENMRQRLCSDERARRLEAGKH